MKLNDFLIENSIEDISSEVRTNFDSDKHTKAVARHKRKPVITLRHINKLKKMKAAKIEEFERRQPLLAVMYGVGGNDDEAM